MSTKPPKKNSGISKKSKQRKPTEEKHRRTNEAFNAGKLAEKMKKQDEEDQKSKQPVGEGLLMVSGLTVDDATESAEAGGGDQGDTRDGQSPAQNVNGEDKKRKKAKKDHKAKRKHASEVEPAQDSPNDGQEKDDVDQKSDRAEKKQKKKARKVKQGEVQPPPDDAADGMGTGDAATAVDANEDGKRKKRKHADDQDESGKASKRDKKRHKSEKHHAGSSKDQDTAPSKDPEPQLSGEEPRSKKSKKENKEGTSTDRFIVFLGNLPFTATVASIEKHFHSIKPDAIRLPAHKEGDDKQTPSLYEKRGGRGKGFAFLEFTSFDRMKTCLKLYHHSLFNDGVSEPRKVNVELTAGGGGSKSEERKKKLKEKNKRLDEERVRDGKKRKREKEEGGKKQGEEEEGSKKEEQDVGMGGMHPSRLRRIQAS